MVVAFVGGATACDSSSEGAGVVRLDEFPRAIAEAKCNALVVCTDMRRSGGGFFSNLLLRSPTAMEDCVEAELYQLRSVEVLQGAIDAGTLAYDALAAGRCIEDLGESCTLGEGIDRFPSCREALQGLLPVGESCTLSEECADGGRCNAEPLADACTRGECVARSPVGAPCRSSHECVRPAGVGSAACETNGETETVCVAIAQTTGAVEGEACGRVDDDGLERHHIACAAEFFCDDPDLDQVGTCQPPLTRGAPCRLSACERGSLCRFVDSIQVCQPVSLARNVGAPCDDEVSYCDHTVRLDCISGRCEQLAPGRCWDATHCASDEVCDFDTCRAPVPDGAACEDARQCARGSLCVDFDGAMGRCMEVVTCG